MHISHTKSFNIPVSIALATLAHMINVYDLCLNTTNYSIFNMQDFRYCLYTPILDCFGQLVSTSCNGWSRQPLDQNWTNIGICGKTTYSLYMCMVCPRGGGHSIFEIGIELSPD